MSWIKIILVNILVLILLLLTAEFGYRAYLVKVAELQGLFINPGLIKKDVYTGLSEYSNILGYVPAKNINITIDQPPYWDNKKISINKMGFRNGYTDSIDKNNIILAAGDSFVFGDSVSDNETWPACLQKNDFNIYNLGVFGYGTAQSLLRIKAFIKDFKIKPKVIILQTLVGNDFYRDTLDLRYGFPSVSLHKKENNIIEYYSPDENVKNEIGSKYSNQATEKNFYIHLSEFSHIARNVFNQQILAYKGQRTRQYINSLKVNEIIDFTLKDFKKLPYKKIFLMQYAEHNLDYFKKYYPEHNQDSFKEERSYLLQKLKEYNINYIDTFDDLTHFPNPNLLYSTGHHSKRGNELICQSIINSGLLP